MDRSRGSGLLVFGVVLGVVGAIMRFAIKVHTSGFNIHTAGVILLIVGVGSAVVGLLLALMSGRSHTVTEETVRATPSGQIRTQERSDSGVAP